MKRAGLYVVAAVAAGWAASHALAQTGVVSGPPQVQDNAPGPGTGGGPAPSPGPRSDISPRAGDATWVAVTAGFKDGRWARVGFARRGSRGDAEIAAIESCNGGPGGVRCENAYSSSSTCLYIVAGKKKNAVTWGRGATKEVALDECRRGGYTCTDREVIGGCPDRPS